MDYIAWIKQGLTQSKRSQSDLARHLGLDPSAITRILSGERSLKSHEINNIAAYFGLSVPTNVSTLWIDVVGVICPGRWTEPGAAIHSRAAAMVDQRWAVEDLSAYQIDATPHPTSALRSGDVLITVDYQKYRPRPLPCDHIVRRRTRNELVSYQLLHCVGGSLVDALSGEPDTEIQGDLVALAINLQRSLQ